MEKNKLRREFEKLARKLGKETAIASNPRIICSNPNCKKLIEMGEPIIPLVLEDYQNLGRFDWCYVLTEISGEDPVPRHHCGRYDLIRDDWLRWGDKKKYITYNQISIQLRK